MIFLILEALALPPQLQVVQSPAARGTRVRWTRLPRHPRKAPRHRVSPTFAPRFVRFPTVPSRRPPRRYRFTLSGRSRLSAPISHKRATIIESPKRKRGKRRSRGRLSLPSM
uniref:Uncharacterized protein n=1 Tax=Rhipicephalus appendiculatus TaxID=34631 RepID=A0A131YD35_RHIAP